MSDILSYGFETNNSRDFSKIKAVVYLFKFDYWSLVIYSFRFNLSPLAQSFFEKVISSKISPSWYISVFEDNEGSSFIVWR